MDVALDSEGGPLDLDNVGPLSATGVAFEANGIPSVGPSRTQEELRAGTDLIQQFLGAVFFHGRYL